jgi:pimeloyl-ACP methyl ester carboxylesterase
VSQGNEAQPLAATSGGESRHEHPQRRRGIVVDRDAVALHGTEGGTGPTVLLLHAGGERRSVWDPLLEPLTASGMRTVAFDLRGHGDSAGVATSLQVLAADVRAMVERERPPVILVGASLGGFAALAALAEPSVVCRVVGLVLVDVVPAPDPDPVRAWLDARGLLADHAAIADDILGRGPQLLATTAALDMPILLVRGGRSPLSDDDVDRLRGANRRVVVTAVERAGHLVARDAPSELAGILTEHASQWLATAAVVQRAFALQRSLGADRIEHPGGTLIAHLRRVYALTLEWEATPRVQLAAICHASYGTDGFPHALLTDDDRWKLRDVIGSDAEALVHVYGVCDRSRTYRTLHTDQRQVFDRFTGGATAINGADMRDFAVLTIANELDVARHATLPAPSVRQIRVLVAALAAHAPDPAAHALADPALA